MASWIKQKFGSSQELEEYLNGALIGTINLQEGADVDNQTFVFEVDGGGDTTVTFTPVKNRPWTIEEIVAKINAAEADLAHIRTNVNPGARVAVRRLKLQKDLTSLVVKTTGTANPELGFSATANTTAVYVAPADIEYIRQVQGEQDTWVLWRYA
jgi:hypothetical protein